MPSPGRRGPGDLLWRLTEPPVPRAGQVSLGGLDPAVVVQILFGLQQRTGQGVKTHDAILRSICNDARRQQVSSLAALTVPAGRGKACLSVVNTMITHVRRGMSGPDAEIARDTWDGTWRCSGTGAACRLPPSPSRGCARRPRPGRQPTCPGSAREKQPGEEH